MRLYTEISFNDFGIFLYSINMNSTRVFLKTQEFIESVDKVWY